MDRPRVLASEERERALSREFARGFERGYDAGLREAATERALKDDAAWYVIRAVIPADVRPVWEEARFLLLREGIAHHTRSVEVGLHLEVLSAEFLASVRAHRDAREEVDG